jgi:predicted outer membrane protein
MLHALLTAAAAVTLASSDPPVPKPGDLPTANGPNNPATTPTEPPREPPSAGVPGGEPNEMSRSAMTPRSDQAKTPDAEAQLLKQLHASNLAEIEHATIASEKATARKVKTFAKTLVKDYTDLDKQVLDEARRLGMAMVNTVPTDLEMDTEKLQTTAGANFDKTFLDLEAQTHDRMIGDVERSRGELTDKRIRRVAETALEKLRDHQRSLQKLTEQVKAS